MAITIERPVERPVERPIEKPIGTPAPPETTRRNRWLVPLAVVLVVLLAGFTGWLVVRAGEEETTAVSAAAQPFYDSCLRAGPTTPDALEAWSGACGSHAGLVVSCLEGAPVVPDAVEHWVGSCQAGAW